MDLNYPVWKKYISLSLNYPDEVCAIKIKKFLSTWWVKQILAGNSSEKAAEECNAFVSYEQHEEITEEWPWEEEPEKVVIRVNVPLLLKWIQNEIDHYEKGKGHGRLKTQKSCQKVILLIEEEEDLVHMVTMTEELHTIMAKSSQNSTLKNKLKEKETFSEAEPHWPSRWVVHVMWTKYVIPKQLWRLHQVESLSIRYPKKKWGEKPVNNTLPSHICVLKDLKVLDVEYCHLISLPPTLQLCTKLQVLMLCGNHFESLPGFLLNLPNLKVLTRNANSLNWTMARTDSIINPADSKDISTSENSATFNCDTLCKISAINVASNIQHYSSTADIDLLDIPKTLHEVLYDVFNSLSICNLCKKGVITKDSWVYYIVANSFLGYTTIPIEGVACSQKCAILARKRITNLNESYLAKHSDKTCFDIEEGETPINEHSGTHRSQKLHMHNGRFMRAVRWVFRR